MPTVTFRTSEFSFLVVALVRDTDKGSSERSLDLLSWRQRIATALTANHGLLGSSIHVDILHHQDAAVGGEGAGDGERVWIRVPRVDRKMVWNALAGAGDEASGTGLRVLAVTDHLTALL